MTVQRFPAWVLATALIMVVGLGAVIVAQSRRDISVIGRKYTYVVSDEMEPEIHVKLNDLVSITFTADDIPHSFTIPDDHYRIDRRAEPGKPVTFQFRADKAGTFEIRCTLSLDPRCLREMKGKLIVSGPDGR